MSKVDDTRGTAVTPGVPATHLDSSPLGVALSAWNRSSTAARTGALIVGVTALAAPMTAGVPVASGVAIAVLVIAALVDVVERRLPNAIVLIGATVLVFMTSIEAATGTSIRVVHIAIGIVVLSGPLLLLHLIAPGSMGFGDVKLAVVLGAAVGAVDWQLAIAALALASGSTAAVGVIGRRSTIAFGPGLVVGTALAVTFHTFLLPQMNDSTPIAAEPSVEIQSHDRLAHSDGVELIGERNPVWSLAR